MSPMTRISLFIDANQLTRLEALKAERGIPVAESIRRAIDRYLADQSAPPTKPRTRKRTSGRSGAAGQRRQR